MGDKDILVQLDRIEEALRAARDAITSPPILVSGIRAGDLVRTREPLRGERRVGVVRTTKGPVYPLLPIGVQFPPPFEGHNLYLFGHGPCWFFSPSELEVFTWVGPRGDTS